MSNYFVEVWRFERYQAILSASFIGLFGVTAYVTEGHESDYKGGCSSDISVIVLIIPPPSRGL
jgi:hypothetical protein